MKNNNEIVILILHYLSDKDTAECVHSILMINDKINIVIIDNNSGNGSLERLKKLYNNASNIYFVENKENLGFACGINSGIDFARKKFDPNFIICCNNDILVLQDKFFEIIIEKYNKYHFWVLGPMICTRDGRYISSPITFKYDNQEKIEKEINGLKRRYFRVKYHLQPFLTLGKNIFNYIRNVNKNESTDSNLKCLNDQLDTPLHGSCLIFSKDYFKKFKGLDPRTFLYEEENILYFEVKHEGGIILYSPDVYIYHKEDASTDMLNIGIREKNMFIIENELKSLNTLKYIISTGDISCNKI